MICLKRTQILFPSARKPWEEVCLQEETDKVKELTTMLKMLLLVPIKIFSSGSYIMLWKVLSCELPMWFLPLVSHRRARFYLEGCPAVHPSICGRNTRNTHLISYTFTGKHAVWTASFQCLAKSPQMGHETHIDFLWVLFLVGRIGPLTKAKEKIWEIRT